MMETPMEVTDIHLDWMPSHSVSHRHPCGAGVTWSCELTYMGAGKRTETLHKSSVLSKAPSHFSHPLSFLPQSPQARSQRQEWR